MGKNRKHLRRDKYSNNHTEHHLGLIATDLFPQEIIKKKKKKLSIAEQILELENSMKINNFTDEKIFEIKAKIDKLNDINTRTKGKSN